MCPVGRPALIVLVSLCCSAAKTLWSRSMTLYVYKHCGGETGAPLGSLPRLLSLSQCRRKDVLVVTRRTCFSLTGFSSKTLTLRKPRFNLYFYITFNHFSTLTLIDSQAICTTIWFRMRTDWIRTLLKSGVTPVF